MYWAQVRIDRLFGAIIVIIDIFSTSDTVSFG